MGAWKEIPSFICWEVWRHQNLVIFEGQNLSVSRLCNRVLQDMGEIYTYLSIPFQGIDCPPLLGSNIAVGFFDGASQNGGDSCGACAVLKCPFLGVFSIK